MAEANKGKFNITLHVYDEDVHVSIDRDEEEYYRRAARLVSERYGAYAQVFSGRKSDHSIALMTLIEIALRYEKEMDRNDTNPYETILSQLTSEIENALK